LLNSKAACERCIFRRISKLGTRLTRIRSPAMNSSAAAPAHRLRASIVTITADDPSWRIRLVAERWTRVGLLKPAADARPRRQRLLFVPLCGRWASTRRKPRATQVRQGPRSWSSPYNRRDPDLPGTYRALPAQFADGPGSPCAQM